jgi:hypothetical protein
MFRDKPHRRWQRWLGRVCAAVQDRLWEQDEEFAAQRGYDARRSHRGWTITVRDPRWDSRQECPACAGRGCGPDAQPCAECAGSGVVVIDIGDAREQG